MLFNGNVMRFFNPLGISSKLFIYLLLPIFTLLFFASITALEKRQQLQNTQNALHFTYIAQQFSAVVYQLQKERGLTAGAIGSRGAVYKVSLVQQRLQTDKSILQLSPIFSNLPEYLSKEKIDKLLLLRAEFAEIITVRSEIDRLLGKDFFDFYSHIITNALNIVSILQQLSIESEQKDLASSYLDILWLEEYSGQERGALNGVFSAQHFNANHFNTISSYIASQHASIRHFYNSSTFENQHQMRKALSDISSRAVEKYREIVFNRVQRNDALNGLQALIGYGGVIHNFKNYMVRGDEKYFELSKQQLNQARDQIEVYRQLPNINEEEKIALNSIENTFQQYQNYLDSIADMKARQSSIREIDDMVKIDDQFALNGIKLLRRHITSHNPELWWKHATRRLDNVHQISTSIADNLILHAQKREYQTQQILYLYLFVTIGVILLSGYIGFKLRSRLVNEIKSIADTMRISLKTHQLLRVTGNDEISDMAKAFNNLITERTRNEEKLQLAAQVFSNAHEGITITDINGCIVDVNPIFCEITGYSREEVIGKDPKILSSGKHNSEFYKEMWSTLKKQGYWKSEIWNRKKNGQIFPEILTISSINNELGDVTHYVALFSDITENKEQQSRLELMAHYDVLTKLPNRALLADRFVQALAHSKRQETLLAVCFLDLDSFKPVNDIYGHETGDLLLIEVADRIKANIRDEDTVSRQGGDEFVLLLGDIESFSFCEKMLSRILKSLSKPINIDGQLLSISASIGVTLYPNDDDDFDALMRHADQAMYQAKLAGRNRYSLFNTEQDQQTIQKNIQLQEIEQALINNEFCLYYQPKINMKTGKVFGAEALIRWLHPEKGLIPPLKFLPVIEDTELEILIGNWVVNEALKQLDIWKAQGINLEVSVNISSYHLQQATFVDDLDAALALYPKVNSKHLQLEILESSALGDLTSICSIINACINTLGVNIALDDFGTGYSSLTHLRNLPAQTIKIDQTFVRDMLDDPGDYAIIDGVIGLANSFNREIIAEGVENIEHGTMLLLMGCEQAQGYGIARPMPVDDIPAWLSSYIPNKEWKNFEDKIYTSKESKIKLLTLSLNQWQKHFEHSIQSSPEEASHWPILKQTKCHCGVLIKRARQQQIFEENWLQELNDVHNVMHAIANDLFKKYQQGYVELARAGLLDLKAAIKKMTEVMERCEY